MSTPVSFIRPLTITSSMIVSSTAVSHSTTELEWSATTNYSVGTVVFRASVGRRFENQIAGVSSTPPEDDQERWYDLGATDRMTMFDSEVSTASIADGALTVVLRPGAFDAIDLRGLVGDSVSVTIKDVPGGVIVYSFSESLDDLPADYWEWCFSPFTQKSDYLITGLAPYMQCEVSITVSNPGRIAMCGMAVFGFLESLGGSALYGVTVEPKSYARITTDERGKTSIKKGKKARDLSVTAMVPIDQADTVSDRLAAVMSVPCTVIATDLTNYRTLRTFGLINGKITYDQPNYATLSLTAQGMI